jgi:hypothetical protein
MTKQEKERFFALYWGQEVFCLDKDHQSGDIKHYINDDWSESYLELYSLEDITEEDWNWIDTYSGDVFSDKDFILERFENGYSLNNVSSGSTLIISDYLRSKGYALPWMGLSVEDMVEVGWIKLKG